MNCKGCGEPLSGRQTSWCSDDCSRRAQAIKRMGGRDYPACARCGRPNKRGGKTRVCGPCFRQAPRQSIRLAEPPDTKVCSHCQQRKPAKSFYPNASRADWLSVYCRTCHSARARQDHASDSRRAKDRRLWARYAITIEEYDAISEAQDGRCAVCRRESVKPLVVDHSHVAPAIVRGLLCGPCNRFKVASLTIADVDAVYAYLHNPPAVAVLGERRVPLGMERGDRRKRRRPRKKKPTVTTSEKAAA